MSSTDNYYIEILNTTIVYIYRFGNPMLYILGNVGNLLSTFIFLKKSWRKNVCVFYFLICLLLHSSYLNSVVLGTAFITGFNINLQNSSVILCKLLNYTALLFATLSPTVLILASIDRLLISSQNIDTRLYSSKRLAYFSVSLSTFFWIIFNIHILIKVNIQQFGPSYFVCYYDLSKRYNDFIAYSLTIFNCLFCLLMIILSILSFKNVRRIKSIPRQQRKQIRSMTKKDFQLLRCLFVQIVVYISLSILPSLFSIYKTVISDQIQAPLEQAIVNFLYNLLTFLFFPFYCSSFYIFLTTSKAFRNELKRLIYKMFGKDLVVLQEEENKQENIVKNNIELNINVVSTIVISP